MDLVSQNLLLTSGGKKDSTYVDDVFSTYLYTGDGQSGRSVNNGIKLGNANAGNSVAFDGNDYLSIAASSDFHIGSGDYTVEAWIYKQANGEIISAFEVGSPWTGWLMGTNFDGNTGKLAFYIHDGGSSYVTMHSASNVASNSWQHVAVTKSGTTFRFFLGGNLDATHTSSIVPGDSGENIMIGADKNAPSLYRPFTGYISNVRITKGQALYTSNFTPSTEALTVTSQGATASNVKLLCCQSSTSTTVATKSPTAVSTFGDPRLGFGPFTANDGEGGMTWIKSRSTGNVNVLFDTVRGANQRLRSDSNLAQSNADTLQPSFTNSGFTVGSGNEVNGSGNKYTSWTFRKAPGFFDVVTWTGTDGNTDRVLSHSLNSIPGCVIIKCTSDASSWAVYHKSLGLDAFKGLLLDQNSTGQQLNKTVAISSTTFTARSSSNDLNKTYVAYLFAGGDSTAATAPSLSFSGSNYLQVASSSDFAYGTGDFTMECWAKSTSNPAERILISNGTDYGYIGIYSQNGMTSVQYVGKGTSPHLQSDGFSVARNQWFHVAISRNSGVSRLFLNGQLCNTPASDTSNYPAGVVDIGRSSTSPNNPWVGNISNVRIVKGTGLYTSSFTPSTKPLENVSGTVLLCCNDSSPTGSTVTPGTITNNNSVTASTDTPFDDPAGYKFGEGGDQNIIKCGQLTTDSTNGSYLELPWEPQWFLLKRTDTTSNWIILDNMRSWTADGFVEMLYPNVANTESGGNGYEELLGRTIKWQGYGNNYDYVYIAIRRPDGYVGKLPEAGTNVFTMDRGRDSSTIPNFDSGFPVDFAIARNPSATDNNLVGSRLTGVKYLIANSSADGTNNATGWSWDSNVGWNNHGSYGTSYQSWMWKRHAGFDVMCWHGNSVAGRQIPHNLGLVPEMIWIKKRTQVGNWIAGHIGMNGGINPWQYTMQVDSSDASSDNEWAFNDTAPTNIAITLGNDNNCNANGQEYIAFLFASVEGISKCGYYDGQNTELTITTGFQPRFIIIKKTNASLNWFVADTTRGWGPNPDQILELNNNGAQFANNDFGAPTATGFTLNGAETGWNESGGKYIYYAHA